MARPRMLMAGLVSAAMLAAAGATPAAAAEPPPGPLAAPGGGPAAVFVELDRPSALQEYQARLDQGRVAASSAARDARVQITGMVDELMARIRGSEDTDELFRTTNAVPGVALRATPAAVRDLATQPGVRSVRGLTTARPSNADALQLGRAVQAWQRTGRLGTGITIGVIDTGIDYTHADFGGPGTVEAFAAAAAGKGDPAGFPTEKVVGGIDLAGDDYDADSPDQADTVPNPDPNPLDCEGHGTHVAGTAAGYGVTADGAAFRGDYASLTPEDLATMRIGPGSAPGASLYAIRVFGCSGSTALTSLGLDHALDPNGDGDFDDRLDVVNLSLGSAFGAVDDPVNDFVRVLSEEGVLVVAAAGNTGDVYDSGGSPGNSPEALAVASVRDAGVLLDGIEVVAPPGSAGPLPGQYSVDYETYDALDVTAPVVELGGAGAQGCEPYAPADAARVRGAVVWLDWSDLASERACGSVPRADNAAAAGAVGVLLTSELADFGGVRIAGNATVPVFQLTGPATAALRPQLAAGGLQVRLAGELQGSVKISVPQIEDTPSTFTARGLRGPTVKPDVAGPGDSITSAAVGSGDGRERKSGTSMASPFVAGVAALVREEHPQWSPEQVKAAIMNTAGADVFAGENRTGPLLAPMRVGAGRVDAPAALATSLLAANAEDPATVSVTFGTVEVPVDGGPLTRREQVRVSNTGTGTAVLGAAYEPITQVPGVRIEVSPPRLVIGPGDEALLDVALRIEDPTALRRTADPTLELVAQDLPRQYLADASGRVALTPLEGTEDVGGLRVPVSVSPKPVSDLSAERSAGELTLEGAGVDQGIGAQAYRSRVGVFALAARSDELPVCEDPEDMEGCVANRTGRGGDIRFVGVTSTAPAAVAAGRPGDARLAFAVTTWADLYNVGASTQPVVRMDVDGDDRPDFATTLTKLANTDVLVASTVDLRTEPEPTEVDVQPVNGFFGDVDTNVFDTDAWVLPVRLAALGIDPAAASAPVRFQVQVLGDYGAPGSDEGVVDTMDGTADIDAVDTGPAVAPVGVAADPTVLLFPAADGTRLTGVGDGPLLVVLNQNGSGDRVELLDGTAPDG